MANVWWIHPDHDGASAVRGLIGAFVVSVVNIWAGPVLLRVYGRWRGGVATTPQLRAAMAWAFAPAAVSIFCWIPIWIVNGGPLNTEAPHESHPIAIVLFLIVGVMDLWGGIILVAAVAEVQQFSIWRTLDSLVFLLLCFFFLLPIAAGLTLLIMKSLLPAYVVPTTSPGAFLAQVVAGVSGCSRRYRHVDDHLRASPKDLDQRS